MSATAAQVPAPGPERSFAASVKAFTRPHTLLMLMLGFSAGLPFLLTQRTLATWLRLSGVDLKTITLASLVGSTYSFKFLWAPLLDHLKLPGLNARLGRRRSWMLVAQGIIIIGLVGLSQQNPGAGLTHVILFALIVAFGSATQDIAVDAWRIEAAPVEEQGAMAAAYQLGYRIALIVADAGALTISANAPWSLAYLVMAVLMGVGITAALLSPRLAEPDGHAAGEETVAGFTRRFGAPGRALAWLYRAVVAPFLDFVATYRWVALALLVMIGLFRIPDFAIGTLARTMYLDVGFTREQIAAVSGFYGPWIGIAGALTAGALIPRLGLMPVMIIGGTIGAASNLFFAWVAADALPDTWRLVVTISADNFSGGFAGTALIAFMSSLVNRGFTATQYALFSSFYSMPGDILQAFSGTLVQAPPDGYGWGYPAFFVFTASMGIPAVALTLLVMWLRRRESLDRPADDTRTA